MKKEIFYPFAVLCFIPLFIQFKSVRQEYQYFPSKPGSFKIDKYSDSSYCSGASTCSIDTTSETEIKFTYTLRNNPLCSKIKDSACPDSCCQRNTFAGFGMDLMPPNKAYAKTKRSYKDISQYDSIYVGFTADNNASTSFKLQIKTASKEDTNSIDPYKYFYREAEIICEPGERTRGNLYGRAITDFKVPDFMIHRMMTEGFPRIPDDSLFLGFSFQTGSDMGKNKDCFFIITSIIFVRNHPEPTYGYQMVHIVICSILLYLLTIVGISLSFPILSKKLRVRKKNHTNGSPNHSNEVVPEVQKKLNLTKQQEDIINHTSKDEQKSNSNDSILTITNQSEVVIAKINNVANTISNRHAQYERYSDVISQMTSNESSRDSLKQPRIEENCNNEIPPKIKPDTFPTESIEEEILKKEPLKDSEIVPTNSTFANDYGENEENNKVISVPLSQKAIELLMVIIEDPTRIRNQIIQDVYTRMGGKNDATDENRNKNCIQKYEIISCSEVELGLTISQIRTYFEALAIHKAEKLTGDILVVRCNQRLKFTRDPPKTFHDLKEVHIKLFERIANEKKILSTINKYYGKANPFLPIVKSNAMNL